MSERKGKIVLLDHPLIMHKISQLRDVRTVTRDFRALTGEIAAMICYEAMRYARTEIRRITTPICEAEVPFLADKTPAVVPVLRAGLGMVDGILTLLPDAKIGHVGIRRDETTHEPEVYFCKLPEDIAGRPVIIPDPMLATGGSAIEAVSLLKDKGCRDIKFLCIIAAPAGIENLSKAHPDIDIYVGCDDHGLNEKAYIVPGLGDAGDRIFGTVSERDFIC